MLPKQKRAPVFWVVLVALIAGVAPLYFFRPTRILDENSVPLEALSRIHREKAKAQKEFAEFIQTPAGKIWEKHPYWDPEVCRKIAEGKVEPGMSREQVKRALGEPKKVRGEKSGEFRFEKWTMEGKEELLFFFEENVLKEIRKE